MRPSRAQRIALSPDGETLYLAQSDSVFALDTDRLVDYEESLSQRFLEGLPEGLELYGLRSPHGRTPTFCFNLAGYAPRELAERLGERGLYVWDGDYYALEPMRALGLDEGGGAVRAGFLHYTTVEEVDRLLEALVSLAARA